MLFYLHDIKDKSEIYSMGHRNPQGLFITKKNNLLISTEHGPNGGDEINHIFLREENGETKDLTPSVSIASGASPSVTYLFLSANDAVSDKIS